MPVGWARVSKALSRCEVDHQKERGEAAREGRGLCTFVRQQGGVGKTPCVPA